MVSVNAVVVNLARINLQAICAKYVQVQCDRDVCLDQPQYCIGKKNCLFTLSR